MMRKSLALAFALVASTLAAACSDGIGLLGGGGRGSAEEEGASDPASQPPSETHITDPADLRKEAHPNPFAALKAGPEQTAAVCARGVNNRVTQAFCGGSTPNIRGIDDLLAAVGLSFKDRSERGSNGGNGNPGFAMLGHSSSIIARNVSAVNPRAIIFDSAGGIAQRVRGYTVVGFTRGETFVELASEDPNTRKLTFYVVKFDLACEAKGSCTNADLFTDRVEKNWTGFTLYEDSDLKNTILDCIHCHQPNRDAPKGLLMREIADPWTHWFRNDRPGGIALLVDYKRVHEGEDYGGIPAALVEKSDARALEDLVKGQNFTPPPNVQFQSKKIEAEVQSSSPGQPAVNTPPGSSPTWNALYEMAVQGQELPPPYHDVKVTDPDKLLYVSTKYVQLRNGQIADKDLPDMRRVFLDDALADLSFIPKKGASGKEVLLQACAQCHQPALDQTISRARFDVSKLDSMDKNMKESAIARMTLPSSDIRKMPPIMMRELPKDALDAAVAELRK